MSNYDVENNEQNYEIPSNDLGGNETSGGIVTKSSAKELIDSVANVDPSRFWMVFMICIVIALASVIIFGGNYLINDGRNKEVVIKELRQELKECPGKTLDDLQKQKSILEDLQRGYLQNKQEIQQGKEEAMKDVKVLQELDKKLNKELK